MLMLLAGNMFKSCVCICWWRHWECRASSAETSSLCLCYLCLKFLRCCVVSAPSHDQQLGPQQQTPRVTRPSCSSSNYLRWRGYSSSPAPSTSCRPSALRRHIVVFRKLQLFHYFLEHDMPVHIYLIRGVFGQMYNSFDFNRHKKCFVVCEHSFITTNTSNMPPSPSLNWFLQLCWLKYFWVIVMAHSIFFRPNSTLFVFVRLWAKMTSFVYGFWSVNKITLQTLVSVLKSLIFFKDFGLWANIHDFFYGFWSVR